MRGGCGRGVWDDRPVTNPGDRDPDDGRDREGAGSPEHAAVAVADTPAAEAPRRSRAAARLDRVAERFGRVEAALSRPAVVRRLEVGAPLAIVALAAVLRLTALGHPHILVFDETYYVKDAYSTWQLGYEGEWSEDANARFEAGDPSGLTTVADYVVHPPLGKWIIGAAMAAFGIADPAMWRLPTAIMGVLLVALTYAIARGLTRSVAFASLAGLWLAIDGFAIVMSRTALLDGVLATLVLAGAGALLLDRRGSPARTVRALAAAPRRFGAAMWARPWLVVAGALLGAACATKWSGAAFVAAFGLWSVLMDVLDRRRAGFRHPWIGTLLTQAPVSFVLLVVPVVVVYVASYAGWFDGGWGSQLLVDRPDLRWTGLLAWVPLGLQALWAYHAQQLGFHVGLTSEHAYESPAIQWLWLGRPTAFESESADGSVWWITALPNLVVWYAAVVALGFLLFHLGRALDRRAGFVLVGVLAGYAPWLAFPDRTIFFFYAIVFLPFLVIGLALALQQLVGPRRLVAAAPTALERDLERAVPDAAAMEAQESLQRRAAGWAVIALLVLLSVLALLWYAPVAYGMWLPADAMRFRFWPPTWP